MTEPNTHLPDTPSTSMPVEAVDEDSIAFEMDMPIDKSPFFSELSQLFNIKKEHAESEAPKLAEIVDYVRAEVGDNRQKILNKINKLKRELNPPSLGETWQAVMVRYIRLAKRKDTLDASIKAYRHHSH